MFFSVELRFPIIRLTLLYDIVQVFKSLKVLFQLSHMIFNIRSRSVPLSYPLYPCLFVYLSPFLFVSWYLSLILSLSFFSLVFLSVITTLMNVGGDMVIFKR